MRSVKKKSELETLIRQFGGNVLANPLKSTSILVAEDTKTPIVQTLLQSAQPALVDPEWVISCTKAGFLLPLPNAVYLISALDHFHKAEQDQNIMDIERCLGRFALGSEFDARHATFDGDPRGEHH